MAEKSEIKVKNRTEDEIDLLELCYFYLSKIVYIIVALVIGALAAGLFTWKCITPQYTATAKMYMVSSSSGSVVDLTDLNIGTSLSEDYVELIQTRPIYEAVIKELNLSYDYETLTNMISIGSVGDTRILTISVTDSDKEEAADIANALADQAKERLPKLMDTPTPTIAENAIVPTQKSSPSYKKNIALGGMACAIIVIMVLTVLFLLDDTFKSADDIEKEFGVMPLTVIPEVKMDDAAQSYKKEKKSRHHKRNKK